MANLVVRAQPPEGHLEGLEGQRRQRAAQVAPDALVHYHAAGAAAAQAIGDAGAAQAVAARWGCLGQARVEERPGRV